MRNRWRLLVGYALLLAGPRAAAQEEWIRPAALRAGDTIALVAPAAPANKERVNEFATLLKKKGFHVTVPDGLFRRNGFLAGSDEERAAELNAAIRDPKVRAIFPCRGGYGLTRILDRIDYEALRKNPKIITGFSDLTALHLAIARKARVVTFHSPMPEFDLRREDGEFAFAARSFWNTLLASKEKNRRKGYDTLLPSGVPQPTRLVGGKARGRLVGGNLTLICATLGTPYALEPKGNILLLEDVDEAPYRIDRMLSQLRLAGVLDEVAGVMVGDFSKTDVPEAKRVLREYLGKLKVPVVMDFPVGHMVANTTLPHGAMVELDANAPSLRVLENPVR
jgi:muramoyltetrapeptide carboxypeptidase